MIHFGYDENHRCTLIARINDVRFHITADAKTLQSKSIKDNKILDEYKSRLRELRDEVSRQQQTTQSSKPQDFAQTSRVDAAESGIETIDAESDQEKAEDNAIDVQDEESSTEDESLPIAADDQKLSLQNWLLSCLANEDARLAFNRDRQRSHSLHD